MTCHEDNTINIVEVIIDADGSLVSIAIIRNQKGPIAITSPHQSIIIRPKGHKAQKGD